MNIQTPKETVTYCIITIPQNKKRTSERKRSDFDMINALQMNPYDIHEKQEYRIAFSE